MALVVIGGTTVAGAAAPPAQTKTETIREQQWHLDALRVPEAHRISTGKGVIVAVVDTGVQADHPDLAGQVLDGTRVADPGDRGKVDEDNHGTGVAGLIAARGGGPNRALGIAPDAKILSVATPIGAFGGTGVGEAIRWAVDHGASVINLSLSGRYAAPSVVEAVRYALQKDVVVVAAAGNLDTGDTTIGSPARILGVLAVSAVDREGRFWSGGVRGPQMGIAAPGTDILTLSNSADDGRPGGYLKVPGGTSAAAPIVAGAAALVRARFPDLSAANVINRLLVTATDAGPEGRDEEYGFGRLDLLKALTADVPPVSANPLGEPVDELDDAEEDDLRLLLTVAAVAGALMLVVVVFVVVLLLWLARRRGPGGRTPAHSVPGVGPPAPPSGRGGR